jgi:xylulokinase
VECVAVAFAEPTRHSTLREANLCTYAHALPGRYASLAYNLTGGNLLRWFRDELAGIERLEAQRTGEDVYEILFRRLPDGPSSLMVLPYFTGSGTPYFDGHTPGAILGLRFDTTREEILLGLLEGLAYELRLNIELLRGAGIPIFEILAVGGGAKNRRWLQLKADILNQPIHVPEVTETGCLGGALLACAAVTGHGVEDLVGRWIRMQGTVHPDPARAAHYEKRLGDYRKTYAALKALSAGIF